MKLPASRDTLRLPSYWRGEIIWDAYAFCTIEARVRSTGSSSPCA